MQSYGPEEIIPRNFLGAGDVLLEEPSQVGVADRLGGTAHALAVGKEQPLAGVVFIQPMEDFTNRSGSVRILADLQVEQNAEQVSLVVIRDAASGQPVVVVLLEPGVEAGFFHRLSKMSRPPL